MRVIAGTYRGRILKSPLDSKTRPTSDRLRETLFNILAPRLNQSTRFLDLCAGTGAVGIEALSRGCAFATFVDKSRRSCAVIESNLDLLEIPEEQTKIVCLSAETFAARVYPEAWDIVYYDPPYSSDHSPVIFQLGDTESKLLSDDSVLVVEHHSKHLMPDAAGLLRRWRLVKQGDSSLSFFERN